MVAAHSAASAMIRSPALSQITATGQSLIDPGLLERASRH